MTCVHLQQLYKLCDQHGLKLGGADLIHLVCNQCGVREVCPSTLTAEYDANERPPVIESKQTHTNAQAQNQATVP